MSTARDVVEAVYAAFAEDDVPRMRDLLADDVRWRQAAVGVPAAGEDAVGADKLIERVVQVIRVEWTEFAEDVEELVAAGEVVTATGTYRVVIAPAAAPSWPSSATPVDRRGRQGPAVPPVHQHGRLRGRRGS